MVKKIRTMALALVLAASMLLAACGSSDDNSAAASSEMPVESQQEDIDSDSSQEDAPGLSEEELLEAYPLLQYEEPEPGAPIATIKTSMGDIKLVLFPEYAPKAVENFMTHAENGYYDGLIFHRVMEDFMIQGGDPEGTGMGGESIYTDDAGNPISFEDEFTPYLVHFRGALSMANAGPNTNRSQFFIVQNPVNNYTQEAFDAAGYPPHYGQAYIENGGTPHLDFMHTVFGMVIDGMDVVDAIAAVPTTNDRPDEDVVIETITIEFAE